MGEDQSLLLPGIGGCCAVAAVVAVSAVGSVDADAAVVAASALGYDQG